MNNKRMDENSFLKEYQYIILPGVLIECCKLGSYKEGLI